MKVLLIATFGLFLFSSCGLKLKDHNKKDGIREHDTTDPVFNSYIQKFETAGKSRSSDPSFSIGDIPINFSNLPDGEVQGVCNEYMDGSKEILIKKSWWNSVDEGFKESLLFHELGHCRLGRSHQDELIQIGSIQYKSSLMNSYIVESSKYIMHQGVYFNELFTGDNSSVVISLSKTTAVNQ